MKLANAFFGLILVAAGPAISASAVELTSCADRGIDLTTLLMPVAQNTRTFGNNSISAFNVDTEEPAAASAGLAIVIPDLESEGGGGKCFALTGFSQIDIMKASAKYDSQRGLLLVVPNSVNVDGMSSHPGADLKIRINLQKSTVTLEQ